MRLTSRASRIDAISTSYVNWRDRCVALSNAYERWRRAAPDERATAYAGYVLELELEERAANRYRSLVERASLVA